MKEKNLLNFLETKEDNFKDVFNQSIDEKKIQFQESNIGIDWTYTMMHFVAQNILLSICNKTSKRNLLLDVGSQFSFISFASSFFDVVCVEPRIQEKNINIPNVCNITTISGEAQKLPIENERIDVITSLHAIEHFGLGRYGDTLDYFGDQKGILEFARVLSPNGFLLTAVPASKKSKIEFNSQRIYNPDDFDDIIKNSGLTKQQGLISYVEGTLGTEKTIESYPEHFTPPVYIAVYKKEIK